MFCLPSFRFSLRLRVLWLLSLRFLLLSLRLLNFLLRLLSWLLNLRFLSCFVAAELLLRLLFWLLNLRFLILWLSFVAEPSPEVVVLAAELFVVELEVSEPEVVFVAVVICC